MTKSTQRTLIIMIFYGMVAALALNRLMLHLHEYVAAENNLYTDYYHAHWNYWWMRTALTSPDLSVYQTDYVLFPYTNSLAFHTLAPFWFPVWALLEPLSNTFVAMNTILWLGLALTGGVTYLFLRDQGVGHRLALIGGALMMLLPAFISGAAQSLPVYVSGFWYAAPLLCWSRIARTLRWRWAVLLGLIFWGMLLTDLSLLLYTPFALAPYGLYTFIHSKARLRLIALGLVPFAVLLTLGWFIAPLQPMLDFERDSVSSARMEAVEQFAMPLEGFWRARGTGHFAVGVVFSGLMIVSLFAPTRDRPRWFWLALAVLPLLMALGPSETIFGLNIPLPYRLLHQASGGVFRMVARFAPLGVLVGLVFIGRGWTPTFRRHPTTWGIVILAVIFWAILADLRALKPFPARPPVPAYAVYENIGRESGEMVVINVPVSISSGWIMHGNFSEAQFYALTHGKRTLNGLIARVPDWTYEFFLHDPSIGWLGGFRPLEPEVVRPQLGEYIQLWDVGYLVVHQDFLNPATGQAEEVLGFLNTLDYLCPVTVERDVVLYRAAAHPDFADCPPRRLSPTASGGYEIPIGESGDELFITGGFHRREIIGGPTARWMDDSGASLLIDLPPAAYTVTLEATAFDQPREVQVLVEGDELARFQVQPEGYQTFAFDLPAQSIPIGRPLELWLSVSGGASGAELGISSDPRILSIALNAVRFEPR